MLKIKSKTAEEVNKNLKKIIEEYKELAPAVFKSITSDNGSEFAKLREVAEYIDIYYAHPYSSFERGTNEKQNSLVRRFLPKKTNFNEVKDEEVKVIQDCINKMPRKMFNYASSIDLFNKAIENIS